MHERPERTEAAEYYFRYIDQVPSGDICQILRKQLADTFVLLGGVSDIRSLTRYAPGKWTIRQVVAHMSDTERLFTFRAFWFGRGFDTPLPSFDETTAMSAVSPDERVLDSHLAEFRAVREATLTFFDHLPPDAWLRRGVASDNPFTVRALAYLAAGHVQHHLKILRERYLAA